MHFFRLLQIQVRHLQLSDSTLNRTERTTNRGDRFLLSYKAANRGFTRDTETHTFPKMPNYFQSRSGRLSPAWRFWKCWMAKKKESEPGVSQRANIPDGGRKKTTTMTSPDRENQQQDFLPLLRRSGRWQPANSTSLHSEHRLMGRGGQLRGGGEEGWTALKTTCAHTQTWNGTDEK